MAMQAPGYLRPVQEAPLTEEEEKSISAICPGLGQTVEAGERVDDVLWGPYVSMCVGWATDPELRYTASSGGALSAILVHLLDSGTVDAVIQTKASPDVPVANVATISRTGEDILLSAGSRYAPSSPLESLGPLLDSNHRYAFVGKPCDVAALRSLARIDPRIDEHIPVMLSFFCAGVPSQTGAEEILRKLGTDLGSTKAFRYRGNGWPGQATATLQDGSERSMSYFDSWGRILSNHVQLRCKVCADGTGAAADIVCADAWESDDNGYPLFEEKDGISLIVARTDKGNRLLQEAQASGRLKTEPFDKDTLEKIQPGQSGRRRALFARLCGLRFLARPTPRYTGLHVAKAARQNSLQNNVRNFLGIIRRGLTGRLD